MTPFLNGGFSVNFEHISHLFHIMFHQVFIVDFEQENLADHAWTCLKFILFEKIGFLQIKKATLHMHCVLPISYFHNFANTFYVNLLLNFTEQKRSDYRACVCVFVCVCVCLCLYSSTVKASSVCKMSETYLRGTDQWSCVVNINLGASVKFLHLRF